MHQSVTELQIPLSFDIFFSYHFEATFAIIECSVLFKLLDTEFNLLPGLSETGNNFASKLSDILFNSTSKT